MKSTPAASSDMVALALKGCRARQQQRLGSGSACQAAFRMPFGNNIARLKPVFVCTSTTSYCSGDSRRCHLLKDSKRQVRTVLPAYETVLLALKFLRVHGASVSDWLVITSWPELVHTGCCLTPVGRGRDRPHCHDRSSIDAGGSHSFSSETYSCARRRADCNQAK